MINLNEEALDAAGIDEGYARDLAVIMQGMANSASQAAVRPQTESETSPEPETIPEAAVQESKEPEPTPTLRMINAITPPWQPF